MTMDMQEILDQALNLSAIEKARLVDEILATLDAPDSAIDAMWRREVADRLRAHDDDELRAVSMDEVVAKYQR